jgi:hypothetical protein
MPLASRKTAKQGTCCYALHTPSPGPYELRATYTTTDNKQQTTTSCWLTTAMALQPHREVVVVPHPHALGRLPAGGSFAPPQPRNPASAYTKPCALQPSTPIASSQDAMANDPGGARRGERSSALGLPDRAAAPPPDRVGGRSR